MSRWRTIHRRKDGSTVLRSPSGTEYRGTASEVRGAALLPDRRRRLAESLKVHRMTVHDAADLREVCAEARREAIMFDAFDVWRDCRPVDLPHRLAIEAAAAARATGRTLADFAADAVRAALAGAGELDLTRHERAALARLDAREAATRKEAEA